MSCVKLISYLVNLTNLTKLGWFIAISRKKKTVIKTKKICSYKNNFRNITALQCSDGHCSFKIALFANFQNSIPWPSLKQNNWLLRAVPQPILVIVSLSCIVFLHKGSHSKKITVINIPSGCIKKSASGYPRSGWKAMSRWRRKNVKC